MQSANAYDNNYMYDGSSCNTWTRFASGTKIANSYVAVGGRQQLKQVSIEMMDNNQSYSLQIYKNVSSTSNPSKGTAVLSTPIKGTIKNTGIYTINLPSGIYLEKGERYSVVFTITSSSGNVFIGSEYDNNYGWFSNDAYLSAKQSYYLWAGDKTWSDGYIITGYCARIKAYTDN